MTGVESVVHVLGLKKQQAEGCIAVLTADLNKEKAHIVALEATRRRLLAGSAMTGFEGDARECVSYNSQVSTWENWVNQQVHIHQAGVETLQKEIHVLQGRLKTIIVQEANVQRMLEQRYQKMKYAETSTRENVQLELWVAKYGHSG